MGKTYRLSLRTEDLYCGKVHPHDPSLRLEAVLFPQLNFLIACFISTLVEYL